MERNPDRRRIAIVTPWFGADLKGGAEQQAWQIATRLSARGHRVEILTTCCRSFGDNWEENHLPGGEIESNGFTTRRFRVDPRDRLAFDNLNRELLSLPKHRLLPGVPPVPAQRASIWTNENINSAELETYVSAECETYRAFVFIPYLYGIALRALPLVARRAWLQPCLHDEAYAYLPDVARIFREAKGLLFNSHGELKLAARLFGPMVFSKSHVVGEGVEVSAGERPVDSLEPSELQEAGRCRYVLCLGRRSREKGIEALISAFRRFRRKQPDSTLKLLLAGPGDHSYDQPAEGIVDLGLVSEARKSALLGGCSALVQPSLNESFSRVLFEAWMHGRPAVVQRECLATACAVEASRGGWIAGREEEWVEVLSRLSSAAEEELQALGENGRQFAEELANWDSVMARYEKLLELNSVRGHRVVGSEQNSETLHQLLPNLSYGDAISNQAIWIREQLQQSGYRSEIFVRYVDPRVRDKCRIYQPGVLNEDDGLLYHHSIGSEVTSAACSHPGRKWLIYHNITPAEFFQPYRVEHARLLRQGRDEMWNLARAFPQSVGVSAYNAEELELYGFSCPRVLPLAIDPASWSLPPDESLMTKLQDGCRNLLYVGRYAPNKCQHDLIAAFAYYRRVDADSRLILVGSAEQDDPYVDTLERTLDKYGLHEHVILTGHVSESQLQAYYRTAHLFWSMSEHEGFCVPLIEAMWFDVPVLALGAAAVGETLADAGVTFGGKEDLVGVAAVANRMATEQSFAEPILRAQRRRRQAFSASPVRDALLQIVSRPAVGCDTPTSKN